MDKSDIAKQLGSLGGKATVKKHGKKHLSNAGKLGMAKRWKDHNKKTTKPRVAVVLLNLKPIDLSKKRDEESGRTL